MPSHLIDPPGAPCTAEDEPIATNEVDDVAAQYGAGDNELRDETPKQFRASAVTGSIPRGDSEMLDVLVRRIVYQDEAAFAIFYRALSSCVFIQVIRITRDVGCAQEVVEDVFWQVWRQAPRFDPQRRALTLMNVSIEAAGGPQPPPLRQPTQALRQAEPGRR